MASSPLAAMLLPALMSKIGGGGGGAPSPGMNPEAIGAAVSQEYSSLQNVDPGKIVGDLQKYKQAISALFPVAVSRVADAAKGISQAVTGLNAAIKAFEKAQEGLKQLQPLGLQSAQPNPTNQSGPGPLPQPTGMMP